ncbi:MAG: FG-GAP repeat protein [Planctomycetes bacterium]|nr:FG-GAP repeat protein [Planctomycetota bacterium]
MRLQQSLLLPLFGAAFASECFSQQQIFQVTDGGAQTAGRTGRFVRNVGDINGDGVEDFASAGFPTVLASQTTSTVVNIHSGASGQLLGKGISGAFLPSSGTFDDLLGFAAGPAGDMNLDGFLDLAIGAPDGPNPWGFFPPQLSTGSVRVYRYNPNPIPWDPNQIWQVLRGWSGDPSFTDFGSSILAVGDVTGDGNPDLAVGDPNGFVAGQPTGFVKILTLYTPTGIEQTISGSAAGDKFGTALASAGDFNGDGRLDYFASAPCGGLAQEGAVRIVSGSTGATIHTVASQVPQRRMGTTLANAGDLDGDGFEDFFTTIQSTNGGSVAAYSSLAGGAFGGGIWAYPADGAPSFAEETASFPDLDGDGYRDLLAADRAGAVIANGLGISLSGKFPSPLPQVQPIQNSLGGQAVTRSVAVIESTSGEKPRALLGDPTYVEPSPIPSIGGRVAACDYAASGLERFGSGTPGCTGPHELTAFPRAALGTANFRIRCSQAPPSSLGLLLMTDLKQLPPTDLFGVGIESCVTPIGATQVFTLDLLSDVSGNSSVLAPIPHQATLAGKQFNAQAIWAWQPSACTPSTYGLSSSLGLEITIQKP